MIGIRAICLYQLNFEPSNVIGQFSSSVAGNLVNNAEQRFLHEDFGRLQILVNKSL